VAGKAKTTAGLALSLLLVGLLLAASVRAEEGPTRDEYFSQVEPICEANTAANKRILKNVRTKARSRAERQVSEAGAQFIHASAVFGKTVDKLAAVPRPPADDARLLRWFKQLRIVQANLRALGKALKEGDEIKAAHEQIRVERSSNAANNVSFTFGFRYCRLTPSRFT
jgi:Pyruvate/2-oxoacid:ferredoxin oxidoreductase gamma subunit